MQRYLKPLFCFINLLWTFIFTISEQRLVSRAVFWLCVVYLLIIYDVLIFYILIQMSD